MTPPKLLDETALKERELQIINSAVLLIQKNGIENLTMDKVVAQVPFSKGTVYKHFIGKEDLLLAISNYSIEVLGDLFYRAYQFKGCARSRMLLLNFSYLIYAMLYPALFQCVMCSKSPNVVGKSSDKHINEGERLEVKLMTSIHGIVDDGLNDNSLALPFNMDIQQLCFSNWSMAYGAITLLSGEVEQCSGRTNLIVERELFNLSNMLFDGMGWQPLTKDRNHHTELQTALAELFPEELASIKAKGRELNFNSFS
ncbi:TetR/AcrR family transcriptional regulator [Colwellia psychrerythraea]|uniref:Transcriptional regulator, TetR family n=1 Tax=Colwellia psychrerythraea TaxID=28229 RepID=A0A099KYF2_COLPS|nr:TetR/AcrR family transcriptional regulator [Colwellia psychrerythraea]KGJ95220.1 transcriptional regulator, TetR family [Colwellia psychrerythraea]